VTPTWNAIVWDWVTRAAVCRGICQAIVQVQHRRRTGGPPGIAVDALFDRTVTFQSFRGRKNLFRNRNMYWR